jgi:hypothetical protein
VIGANAYRTNFFNWFWAVYTFLEI